MTVSLKKRIAMGLFLVLLASGAGAEIAKAASLWGRGWLGLSVAISVQVNPKDSTRTTSALVNVVMSDGPASRAGIRNGDRVLSVNGIPVSQPAKISAFQETIRPGQEVEYRVRRGSEELTYRIRAISPFSSPL